MSRPVTFDTKKAVEELSRGKTLKEVAMEVGTSYENLWHFVRRQGIKGGYRQRDKRSLEEKIRDRVQFTEDGCAYWIGSPVAFTKVYRTPSICIRYLVGWKGAADPSFGKICGNRKCLNPHHFFDPAKDKMHKRDAEIQERWRLHLKHKTTAQMLAKEYGLTRQRIQQILNRNKKAGA